MKYFRDQFEEFFLRCVQQIFKMTDQWSESMRLAADNYHGAGGHLLEKYGYCPYEHNDSDIMKKELVLPNGVRGIKIITKINK